MAFFGNGNRAPAVAPSEMDPSQSPTRYHALLLALLVSFGIGFFAGYSHPVVGQTLTTVRKKFAVDPSFKSTMELLGQLSKARTRLEESLIGDYGDYYGVLFDRAVMDNLFISNPISKERLLRRMMIKIVKAQIEENTIPRSKLKPKNFPTFIWATAGDSVAAGHGNLYTQSYTSVMENTVKDAFESVGVNFVAKNYAMGGYVSAPELALCMESVYGSHLDVLAWDFGMMERNDVHRVSLWGSRASVHPTKPVLFLMDSSQNTMKRWEHFLHLEQQGMGTLLMDQSRMAQVRGRIPDSETAGGGNERTPAPLRNFMCSGLSEGAYPCDDTIRHFVCNVEGENICIDEKFKTRKMCIDAKYQTSWHPGWKEHYLKGRIMGFYIVEMLNEALTELDELKNAYDSSWYVADRIWEKVLDHLLSKEEEDKTLLRSSPALSDAWEPNKDTLLDVNPNVVYKKNVICHTALLPAQERYDGILAESGRHGSPWGEYDRGMNKYFVELQDRELPLVFDPNDRQRCDALEIDHKDFFYVRQGDGWLSTVVPNKSEIEAYGKGVQSEGLIMVCLRICPLKRCADDAIGFGAIKRKSNLVQIRVDGEPVVGIQKFEDCHFLVGENGLRWGRGKAGNGQYKLSFQVNAIEKHMMISSIVIL